LNVSVLCLSRRRRTMTTRRCTDPGDRSPSNSRREAEQVVQLRLSADLVALIADLIPPVPPEDRPDFRAQWPSPSFPPEAPLASVKASQIRLATTALFK
jgi:hypothetical protein